ncbi:MAG: hypothetical protein WA864_16555 [Acetobacteraceae bacterium]
MIAAATRSAAWWALQDPTTPRQGAQRLSTRALPGRGTPARCGAEGSWQAVGVIAHDQQRICDGIMAAEFGQGARRVTEQSGNGIGARHGRIYAIAMFH